MAGILRRRMRPMNPALAALLAGAYVPAAGERVGILVCGGNFDPSEVA